VFTKLTLPSSLRGTWTPDIGYSETVTKTHTIRQPALSYLHSTLSLLVLQNEGAAVLAVIRRE